MKKIRVLVVDDSVFMRRVLIDLINSQSDMEVVAFATSGVDVLEKVQLLKPDVISMDIEMPGKNGLMALQEVMASSPTPVVMCSTLTSVGAEATMIALEIGACDFVAKPTFVASETLRLAFSELISKLRIAAGSALPTLKPELAKRVSRKVDSNKVLLIASSTGGPKALMTLMQSLPKKMNVPAVIVQHMPTGFTTSLAKRLGNFGSFECREATEGDVLKPGLAYIAPGGSNLQFVNDHRLSVIDIDSSSAVPKPNADVLFTSAATHLGSRCLCVILTGMGKDGTEGGKLIHKAGGTLLGEEESSCAVYGMSRSAQQAGIIKAEYSITEIGAAICDFLEGGNRAAA